jgi:hypothetical protein
VVGRRDFLKILGLTTLAGMTPPMLEALGDEKGVPIPGLLLDTLDRPLVVSVPNTIQHVGLEEIDDLIKKRIIPGLTDLYFKQDPLLAYLRKYEDKADSWREARGYKKMDYIWVPDKEGKPVINEASYPRLAARQRGKSAFWEEDRKTRIVLDRGRSGVR